MDLDPDKKIIISSYKAESKYRKFHQISILKYQAGVKI